MTKYLITCVTAYLLYGCVLAPPIRAYSGPPKLLNEIAYIKCSTGILVNAIDGISIRKIKETKLFEIQPQGCEIVLLPGIHTLDVCYVSYHYVCKEYIPLTFNAEADHIYFIDAEINLDKGTWKPRANIR